ncbi:MAG: 4-phosphoerythronate dehydrogenase [Candidatus Hydrogenedentes bacterium]|nr:4-phosphoerythronate dehydrogenase [Candidatus Hydrogenedentota bacterium]
MADENIPLAREAFGALGEVRLCPGRGLRAADLGDANVLMVRSITEVNAALLEGTGIQFVGTATIGEDHIDRAFLATRGIGFSSAPGCNANSVSEYITAALLELARRYRLDLGSLSLGVIGCGNVGKRVLAKARTLGMRCVVNDEPLAAETKEPLYRSLEETLACDIVTLHVPLERGGPYPTRHLMNDDTLARMRPGAILMNTSRGAVVATDALRVALDSGHLRAAVLDVWEKEPNIAWDLLERVAIGTPHIAGYSYDGKVNGTRQMFEAAAKYFGVAATWDPAWVPNTGVRAMNLAGGLDEAVAAGYDLLADDRAMRALLALPEPERGAGFDALRKQYPVRREFPCLTLEGVPDPGLVARLRGLGFGLN